MNRRTLFGGADRLAAISLVAAGAVAQTADDFPNRPIRIIVPQAAGSGVDLQARVLAQKMGELWGQQGVVENRPGANAIIGMEAVAKAAPDGYTLVYAPVSAVTTQRLHLQEAALRRAARLRADHPDRRQPAGRGRQSRLRAQVDQGYRRAGQGQSRPAQLRLVRHRQHDPSDGRAAVDRRRHQDDARALRGQTPEITDILAGQIPLGFTTTAGVTDLVETGKLNLLATFGAKRDEQFPNTPTPTEAGYPSVVVVGWAGLLAPAGTPPQIISKLHGGMAKALAMPDVKDAILKQGSKAVSSNSPEEFERYIKSECAEIPPRHQGRRPRRLAVSG